MTNNIKNIIEKIKARQPLTDAEKMENIRYSISTHDGKLAGIPSISTSCLCNAHCIARSKNPAFICHDCYAMTYTDFRKTLREKLKINTIFYTTYEIHKTAVPLINTLYFRFESFGDLVNEKQFQNYCTIARVNKNVNCALWTKNPWIIKKAIENGVKIPANMKIIYSIDRKNTVITKEYFKTIKSKYQFINAIFAVHDDKSIEENNVNINCGGKSCMECGYSCYKKACRIKLINERKK